jgi:hypothetical protein
MTTTESAGRRRDDTRVRDALLVAPTVSSGVVDALSRLGLGKVFSVFTPPAGTRTFPPPCAPDVR